MKNINRWVVDDVSKVVQAGEIVKRAAAVSMRIDTESFLKLVEWMSFSVNSDIYVAIYGVSDDSHETKRAQKPHFNK